MEFKLLKAVIVSSKLTNGNTKTYDTVIDKTPTHALSHSTLY